MIVAHHFWVLSHISKQYTFFFFGGGGVWEVWSAEHVEAHMGWSPGICKQKWAEQPQQYTNALQAHRAQADSGLICLD